MWYAAIQLMEPHLSEISDDVIIYTKMQAIDAAPKLREKLAAEPGGLESLTAPPPPRRGKVSRTGAANVGVADAATLGSSTVGAVVGVGFALPDYLQEAERRLLAEKGASSTLCLQADANVVQCLHIARCNEACSQLNSKHTVPCSRL